MCLSFVCVVVALALSYTSVDASFSLATPGCQRLSRRRVHLSREPATNMMGLAVSTFWFVSFFYLAAATYQGVVGVTH